MICSMKHGNGVDVEHTKHGKLVDVKQTFLQMMKNITNKSTSFISCKRITLTLVLCMVAAICIKIYLNPSVLKLADAGDFQISLMRNNSYRNHTGSIIRTNTSNMSRHRENIKQKTNLKTDKVSNKTAKTAVDTRNNRNAIKAKNTNSAKCRKKYINKQMDYKNVSTREFIPEDLMKQGPFLFLNNYKNPCWKPTNNDKKDLLCLPYFYLIGAPKSGTTDLHVRLIKHPDVSKLVQKEPHWLPRKHYKYYSKSKFKNYLQFFTRATREIKMEKDSRGYHKKIFGDCSASTMWDNDYWTTLPEYSNLSEPLYTNADYIHHLNPSTKIIAMLRNPVERLYSDYLYFQHGTQQKFHKGVVNTIKDARKCLNKNTLRHCLYTPKRNSTKIRLRIGVYHLHLKEYLRLFPRDQIMVIKLEDFSIKTASYMQKIFEFLDITKLNEKDLKLIANPDKHANTRKKVDRKTGEMLPETRKLLEEFYRPHNELLTELLGEKFNYNKDFG